ncbi:MAG: hypothetical protein RLZ98_1980 [Pseudomonadota bacterium]
MPMILHGHFRRQRWAEKHCTFLGSKALKGARQRASTGKWDTRQMDESIRLRACSGRSWLRRREHKLFTRTLHRFWRRISKALILRIFLVAHPRGFEPLTSAFGGQRSIQLSYGCIKPRALCLAHQDAETIPFYGLPGKGLPLAVMAARGIWFSSDLQHHAWMG